MKEDVFLCFSCPPDSRKRMHLCDLREHIAEKHLDNYHLFHCPKCNKRFATGFQAHKHIREVCKISGIVPMQNYATSLLSYDSTYLNKMYKMELTSIFRYVSACSNANKPSVSKGINTDPMEKISTERKADRNVPFSQNEKLLKSKAKKPSRWETEREDESISKPITSSQQSTDSGTETASTHSRTDFLSEMASPGVKEESRGTKRTGSPDSFSRSVDVEPPSECGENDSDSLTNFSVKMEADENNGFESNYKNHTGTTNGLNADLNDNPSSQPSVPKGVPNVPLLIPKQEPADVDENWRAKTSWRPFKKEPQPDEQPPPASPDNFSDSMDSDQCDTYDDHVKESAASSADNGHEANYPFPPTYQNYDQNPHVFGFDPNHYGSHQFGGIPDTPQVPLAPEGGFNMETEEARRFREQCEMLAKKFMENNQQQNPPSGSSHSSSSRKEKTQERTRKRGKRFRDRREQKPRETYLPPTTSSSNEDYFILKVVVPNSNYHRIVREDHVCEYETCCDYDASEGTRCMFCNGLHFSLNCASFPTYNAREAVAVRRKICMRCGTIHPLDIFCPGVSCCYCNRAHYGAFCFSKKSTELMKENAIVCFARWLPNIPELDAFKGGRAVTDRERKIADADRDAERKRSSRRRLGDDKSRSSDRKKQRRRDD